VIIAVVSTHVVQTPVGMNEINLEVAVSSYIARGKSRRISSTVFELNALKWKP
jgi:hypothetical protein